MKQTAEHSLTMISIMKRGKLKRERFLKKKQYVQKCSCSHKEEQNKNIYKRKKHYPCCSDFSLCSPPCGFSFTLWFVSNKGCTLAFHHLSFPIYYEEQGRVHTYTSEVIGLIFMRYAVPFDLWFRNDYSIPY